VLQAIDYDTLQHRMIAKEGKGVGQVSYPWFMCESTDGGIMVCDAGNRRIQEFFLDGRPARIVVQFNDGTQPSGITRCDNGDYIVTDDGKNRVMRIDSRGNVKWTVGSQGKGREQFNNPYGVAVFLNDRVAVVADFSNHRLQVLNADTGAVVGIIARNDGVTWNYPSGVTVDANGLLYVVEYYNHRVVVIKMDGTVVRTLGSKGSGPSQLYFPWGVFVDGNGNVLVGDRGNNRVVVFRLDDTSTHFATPGKAVNALITSNNRLVVSSEHFVAEYA